MISKTKAIEVLNDVVEYCTPYADIDTNLYFEKLKYWTGSYILYVANSGSVSASLNTVKRKIEADIKELQNQN